MTVLSTRDAQVISLLAGYRYLTRAQLAAFLFEDADAIAPQSQEVLTQRILRRLTGAGLVAGLPRPRSELGGGTARIAYCLTRPGYALARTLGAGLTEWRPALRSTVQLSHGLVTADVGLAFRRAARARQGHAVSEWALDRQAAARAGSAPVIPDGLLIYRAPECELHAFIEVDLDTEPSRIFGQKVRQYLDLYRSGAWHAHLRAWPIVITITPTETRAALLHRVTEAVLLAEPDAASISRRTEFDVATLPEVLATAGPLAAIWRVAGRAGRHPLIPTSHGTPDGEMSADPAAWPIRPRAAERCVYVIELDDVERPRTTPLPCVYVGQSAYSPETRLAQHQRGYKSSRYVRRFGKHLRPDLSAHVPCTPEWQTALRREADLAAELRRAGYCVHGGH